MYEFYEKLISERDTLPPNRPSRNFKNNVLTQLFIIAFTNDEQPDELPDEFYIHNVFMPRDDFKDLLSRLGISANVNVVKDICFNGHTFNITLKKD